MGIDKVINQKKQNLTNTNFLDISCFPLTNSFYVICFLSLPLTLSPCPHPSSFWKNKGNLAWNYRFNCHWDVTSVQFSSVAQSGPILCDAMNRSMPGLPVHHQLPEFTQTHAHRVGDAIQPSHPLSSTPPPAPNPSQHQGLFQWVISSHEVAKVLEFQLLHQSLQWMPGLISLRMDWLDLLAVQGTLKSLLQHHSSKALILWCSAFFTAWLSHPYMTTGKTIALTRQTFVGKVISLLFNMLSRLVITFLPRSKRLLTSWLQSPSAVILEKLLKRV